MAYVNIPPNLQDMFYGLSDRIAKLESGPSGPQDTADTAQSTAVSAQSSAANASAQALLAQSQATIASSQATQAQTSANGKNTILYGASATPPAGTYKQGDIYYQYDGSNHIKANLQYSGSAWVNAPFTQGTFTSLDAGAITTGTLSAIEISAGSGGTAFHVSPSGVMSAQGVYVKGDIYADTGSFSGSITASSGSIGNFNIISGDYLQYGTTFLYGDSSTSTTYAFYNNYRGVLGNVLYASSTSSSAIYSNGGITSNTAGFIGTSLTVGTSISSGTSITANGHLIAALTTTTDTSSSSANAVVSAASGIIYRSTSSQRYKVEITPQSIPATSIMALQPKSYVDKKQSEEKGTTEGLPRYVGLIAEDVAQIDVLKDLLVVYNENNEPDAINYDRIAVALIPLLQNHETRLNKLEGK